MKIRIQVDCERVARELLDELISMRINKRTSAKEMIMYAAALRTMLSLGEVPLDLITRVQAELDRHKKEYGMTDAIRSIYLMTPFDLDANDVRVRLELSGFDLRKYSFAMASIHSTIKRLRIRGEIVEVPGGFRTPKFRWATKTRRFQSTEAGVSCS